MGLLVFRIKNWPSVEAPRLVSLGGEQGGQEWSPARLVDIGAEVALKDGPTLLRAEATPPLVERCTELGRGSRVLVQLRRSVRPVEGAGYRDDAGQTVFELAYVMRDPRGSWVPLLFQGAIGAHLVFALLGLAASIVAFFLWP